MYKVIVYEVIPQINPEGQVKDHLFYKTETFSLPELYYMTYDHNLVFRDTYGNEVTRQEIRKKYREIRYGKIKTTA